MILEGLLGFGENNKKVTAIGFEPATKEKVNRDVALVLRVNNDEMSIKTRREPYLDSPSHDIY